MPGPPEALSKCDVNYIIRISERVPRSHTPSSSPPNKREGVGGARRLEANTTSGLECCFCCSVAMSLQPRGLQHARLPCPSPSPGVCSNSCPLSQGCHPAISSSVISFSSCLQSSPPSGSFPVSWLFASGGHSIGASASTSVLPMNILG